MHGPRRRPLMSRTLTAALAALALLTACGREAAPVLDVQAPTATTDEVGPYAVTVVITYGGAIRSAVLRWYLAGASAPQPVDLKRDGDTDRWTAELPGQ